jgi:hypothetical protein
MYLNILVGSLILKKLKKSKQYKAGVKDSLRVLFTHITSIEHGVGFAASQKAEDYVEMMKQVYNTINTLYEDE